MSSLRREAARWISIAGHPFVTSMLMIFGVALRLRTPGEAVRSVLLVASIVVVPVGVLMFRQVRTGSWSNADASKRAERPVLFTVGSAALAVLLGIVVIFRPGSFLIRGAAGMLIMLAVCAVATKWVKLSLHVAFAALGATILLLVGSPLGWLLFALLPAVAWSRLALKRHTRVEITAGLIAGVVAGYAIYTL